jgi:MazG family protein
MKAFDDLLCVADKLHGPEGCPWDHKQTFFSLQPYVLEEAHEVVEAVDGQDDAEIAEELGDLLYTVVFYAKLAEKEKRFSMETILETVKDKLIRRHPHVFGDVKTKDEEEIVKNWQAIKQEEKGKKERVTPLDGIPDGLPALSRMQKMVRIFSREKYLSLEQVPVQTEEEIATALYQLIQTAEKSGVDIEGALRRKMMDSKKQFLESHLS